MFSLHRVVRVTECGNEFYEFSGTRWECEKFIDAREGDGEVYYITPD